MKLNMPATGQTQRFTHEGAPVVHINAAKELRRSVMSCMLWEDGFYESGMSIADRIQMLAASVAPEIVAEIAIKARNEGRLRHVPLWLTRALARRGGSIVGRTLTEVIQRPDELTEFLAMYWKDGKSPLSKQVKIGLANAFRKFDAYQLGKYNRNETIKLRDVLFLTHAKPKDEEQAAVWKRLVDGDLESPDTWEVALSKGGDKKEEFTRLLEQNKLGYMALLRNLRNMVEAGVNTTLISEAIVNGASKSKALPFRFISAAKHAPEFEFELDVALIKAVQGLPKLKGKSAVIVDVSGSMSSSISGKSEISCADAAAALSMIVAGCSDKYDIYAFGTECEFVSNNRQGKALHEAIAGARVGHGTDMSNAVRVALGREKEYDRIIIISDMQSYSALQSPPGNCKGYTINVHSYQNGVGYGPWTSIDGFSEATVKFIQALEAE
jgi:60 kDa SS-A/Ro ribonucleoprotein